MKYWNVCINWPPGEARAMGLDRIIECDVLAPTRIGAQRKAKKKLDELTRIHEFHSALVTLCGYSDRDGVTIDRATAWQISWTREKGSTRWKSRPKA